MNRPMRKCSAQPTGNGKRRIITIPPFSLSLSRAPFLQKCLKAVGKKESFYVEEKKKKNEHRLLMLREFFSFFSFYDSFR